MPPSPASPTILRRSFPALALVLLAGCATTDPKATLPAVQQQIAARSDFAVSWPLDADERAASDRAVQSLLNEELTPATAVQIALLNNRHLRATFEELGVSQADLAAATRLRNPTFAASVRWPDQLPRGPNVEFSLVADLLDDLLIPLRKKVAREQLAQAGHRVAHEVLSLAAEVKAAVYTVQARQLFADRLAAVAAVNAAATELTQRKYDAGNIGRLDLNLQQFAAGQSRLEQARAEAQLKADREKVNRLLSLTATQNAWKIAAGLPALPGQEPALDQIETVAIAQRLDLALAASRIALAESALALKRSTRLLPVGLSLGVDTERESSGGRLTGPRLELGLPIFDQGQPELARLGSELRRALANHEALSAEIQSEVREARDALLAARATVDTFTQTLLPQRRLILQDTLLQYNAMQKSSYELLAAKEQQLRAERESIEALRDYWIARVQLERALGGKLPGASAPPAPKAETLEGKTSGKEPAHHSHK